MPITPLYPELHLIQTQVYDQCNLTYTLPIHDAESEEYAACSYAVNDKTVKYRAAKITPTKPGLFVTIWKRNGQGITAPFDEADDIDLLAISARSGSHFGHFVFRGQCY